jgi:hypothetical protein
VRVLLQPLVPGMEHAEEADLRAEVAGSRAISSRMAALAWKSRLYITRLFWSARGASSRGRVKTRCTYRVGSSSCSRAWSQRRRAFAWHLGQCRLRHEL